MAIVDEFKNLQIAIEKINKHSWLFYTHNINIKCINIHLQQPFFLLSKVILFSVSENVGSLSLLLFSKTGFTSFLYASFVIYFLYMVFAALLNNFAIQIFTYSMFIAVFALVSI